MSSFVVRIENMEALLENWEKMLKDAKAQVYTMNTDLFVDLRKWPRIKFFYYCDDSDGNTIRLYDNEHFNLFGGSHYLEPDGRRKEHFERVILRGRNMWAGDKAGLDPQNSLRNKIRNNPAWRIFSARKAPLRPGTPQQSENGIRYLSGDVDIQGGMLRERRLWYFDSVNQLPAFDPPRAGELRVPTIPAGMSPFERFMALRAAQHPNT